MSVETGRQITVRETLNFIPRNGIGIHGTSSHRATSILEKGLEPKCTTLRTMWAAKDGKKKGVYYFSIDPDRDMAVIALEKALRITSSNAITAALNDINQGIVSEPVLVVFKSPLIFPVLGSAIARLLVNPIFRTRKIPEHRMSRRIIGPESIMGILPLQGHLQQGRTFEMWTQIAEIVNNAAPTKTN